MSTKPKIALILGAAVVISLGLRRKSCRNIGDHRPAEGDRLPWGG